MRALQDAASWQELGELWTALAEMGVLGLPFPEEFGGQGAGLFELGLVLQEAGRAMCPTVVPGTLAFGIAVARLGSDGQRARWLAPVAAGRLRAGVALWNPSDASDLRPTVEARRVAAGWVLSGAADFVPNADLLDELLVSARDVTDGPDGPVLAFAVKPSEPGWRQIRRQTFSRDIQCRVVFDGLEVSGDREFPVDGDGLCWVSHAVTALQCMEQVGGAYGVLDMAVEYVKVREQFGRPLGSFQAVQHHVADVRIAAEAARLTASQAVCLVGAGQMAEREVAIAKLHANEAYKLATLTAHQLFGGMGYMRETDLHLWSQRAKSMEILGGARDVQLARLERALGLASASEASR